MTGQERREYREFLGYRPVPIGYSTDGDGNNRRNYELILRRWRGNVLEWKFCCRVGVALSVAADWAAMGWCTAIHMGDDLDPFFTEAP